jgi:hypothetical protein
MTAPDFNLSLLIALGLSTTEHVAFAASPYASLAVVDLGALTFGVESGT